MARVVGGDSNLQPDRYERRGLAGKTWKHWRI